MPRRPAIEEVAHSIAATTYSEHLADPRITVLAALTEAASEGIRVGMASGREEIERLASERDLLREMMMMAAVVMMDDDKKAQRVAVKGEAVPCPWCQGKDPACKRCEGHGKVMAFQPPTE